MVSLNHSPSSRKTRKAIALLCVLILGGIEYLPFRSIAHGVASSSRNGIDNPMAWQMRHRGEAAWFSNIFVSAFSLPSSPGILKPRLNTAIGFIRTGQEGKRNTLPKILGSNAFPFRSLIDLRESASLRGVDGSILYSMPMRTESAAAIKGGTHLEMTAPLSTSPLPASLLSDINKMISSSRLALRRWKSAVGGLIEEPVPSIRAASLSMYVLNAALARAVLRHEGHGFLGQTVGVAASLFASHHIRVGLLWKLNALDASESASGTTPSVDATISALFSQNNGSLMSISRIAILAEASKQWVPRSCHAELFERWCAIIILQQFVQDNHSGSKGRDIIPKIQILAHHFNNLIIDLSPEPGNIMLRAMSRAIAVLLPMDDAGMLLIDRKNRHQIQIRARLLLLAHCALRNVSGVTVEQIVSLHRILDVNSCKDAVGAYLSDYFEKAASEFVSAPTPFHSSSSLGTNPVNLELTSAAIRFDNSSNASFEDAVDYIRSVPDELLGAPHTAILPEDDILEPPSFSAANMNSILISLVQQEIQQEVSNCMNFARLTDFDSSRIARLVEASARIFSWEKDLQESIIENVVAPLYTNYSIDVISRIVNGLQEGVNLAAIASNLSATRTKLMLSHATSKRCFRQALESVNKVVEAAMEKRFNDNNRRVTDDVIELFLDHARILQRVEAVYKFAWNVTAPKLEFPRYELPSSAQIGLYKKVILPLIKRDSLTAHKGADRDSAMHLHEILRRMARVDPSVMELHDRELLLPKMLSQITTAFRTDTLHKWNTSFYENLLADYSIPLEEWRQNISIELYRNELERFSPPLANFGVEETTPEEMMEAQKAEGEEESNLFSHMNEEERQQLSASMSKQKHKTRKDCWPKLPAVPHMPSDAELERLQKFSRYLQCDQDLLSELHACIFGEVIVQTISSLNQNMSFAGTMSVVDRVNSLRKYLSINPDIFESLVGLAVLRRLESGVYNMTQLWREETGQKCDSSEEVKMLVARDTFVNQAVRMIDNALTIYRLFGLNMTIEVGNSTISKVQVERTDELGDLYKLFAYHRMVDDRFGLKKKFSETEIMLSKVLGFTEEETNLLKADLAERLVSNLLKSTIQVALQSNNSWVLDDKLVRELKIDLSWIQNNVGINTTAFKGSFVNASRDVVTLMLEELSEPAPRAADASSLSAPVAAGYSRMDARVQRILRMLLSELDLDLEQDICLPRDLLDDLFVLELQGLVDGGRLDMLSAMASSYGIDEVSAREACSGLAEKYLHEVVHFALLNAKDNDDEGCRKRCAVIARYIDFVRHPVYADASQFKKDDVDRVVMNFEVYLDGAAFAPAVKARLVSKLRDHVALSSHARAAMSDEDIEAENDTEKSDWNWG